MSFFLALTASALAGASALPAVEHRTRIEHSGDVVDVHYRSEISLVTRQIGSAAKAGIPSTLRCLWRADLDVQREAIGRAGAQLARGIDRAGVLEGSRPGWCDAHRASIAQELARRADQIRTEVNALAQEDHDVLKAEIERSASRRDG